MNGPLFVAAIAAFLVASTLAIDCRKNPCTPSVHTLCKYPDQNPAAACGSVSSVGFTEAEKTEIINKHNELRQLVAAGRETRGNPGPQPAASNMKTVSWDEELADVAQRWAIQCNFGHDECRRVERFVVGQNVGMSMTTGEQHAKPSDVIMMWYNEVTKMDRNLVNKLTTINNVGHYTQLVWGDTEKVGCGKIVYKSGDGWNTYYMVCNYGPTGNWMGQPVYHAIN